MNLEQSLPFVRQAGRTLASLSSERTDQVLHALASAVEQAKDDILTANAMDLSAMDEGDSRYDRLRLTPSRIRDIADALRHVADLPSPLGKTLMEKTLPNGLRLSRVRVPFGVIGIIFESRPNVCFDCFALCFKAGSACVLKGGSDARHTCQAIVNLIHAVLAGYGLPVELVLLITGHEETDVLLGAREWVDLIIPRGSRRLIDYVREHSRVPVIETGAGVVHTYVDKWADLNKATAVVLNAKTRRVSVCNALDCLLIHRDRRSDLVALCAPLVRAGVAIEADEEAYEVLHDAYPHSVSRATAESFGTEFLALRMSVRTVGDVHEAMMYISRYGSGHSECIVTEDEPVAELFLQSVDAACVYHNASTGFTDGGEFGLGAEIGISTQKLHARGPMALEEITTYKWIIRGSGQTRK